MMPTTAQRELLFVAEQAAKRLPELTKSERALLIAGLKQILPRAEFEQCLILTDALDQADAARAVQEQAQLILSEMFATTEPRKIESH